MIIMHLVPDLDPVEATAGVVMRAHINSPLRVTEDRTRAALELLDACPLTTPAPELRIALDGELALYWEQGRKKLVVIPQVNGWLKFGVEFGRERREGSEIFIYPKLPDVVGTLLAEFKREDA